MTKRKANPRQDQTSEPVRRGLVLFYRFVDGATRNDPKLNPWQAVQGGKPSASEYLRRRSLIESKFCKATSRPQLDTGVRMLAQQSGKPFREADICEVGNYLATQCGGIAKTDCQRVSLIDEAMRPHHVSARAMNGVRKRKRRR